MSTSQRPREGRVFGYSDITEDAAFKAADKLVRQEGMSWEAAVAVVTTEIFGAGEGLTVESMATCRDLGGYEIKGVSTDDSNEPRFDKYAKSEKLRNLMAETGTDDTGEFILKKDKRTFIKLHGKKLAQAALSLKLDTSLPIDDIEDLSFPWEKLRLDVLQAIKQRIVKRGK